MEAEWSARSKFTTPRAVKIGIWKTAGIAWLLFSAGFGLTMIGIGAIIGVPMMVIAAILFVGAPLFGLFRVLNGPCPYCSSDLTASPHVKGVTCPACKKRVVVRDSKFFGID